MRTTTPLPSPQQTRPCITSPVSCDTEGGGGSSCLRERAPQPPVHQSLQSSTAEREDLCLYTAVRYTQTYIPARTQVPRNTCRNTPGKCFPALPVLARSSQTTKHTHTTTHTGAQSKEVRDVICQHTMRIQYRNHMLNVCRGRGRERRWQMDRGRWWATDDVMWCA